MTASPTDRRGATRRVTELALLTAMALCAQWLESLLPPVLPVVPVRLGLANVFTLFALLRRGRADALLVTLLRCLLFVLVPATRPSCPIRSRAACSRSAPWPRCSAHSARGA